MKRVVVVPCFNEARRLDTAALRTLAERLDDVVIVDDGSTDDTAAIASAAGFTVLRLTENGGKGEAVRHGLRHALAAGADVVAYLDADLATPIEEVLRLFAVVDEDGGDEDAGAIDVVLGSRIAHLGAQIERRAGRHYLGRLFATTASLALGLGVYDTQCGAKVFRATPALATALSTPFRSRWAFDVELLGRLLDAGSSSDRWREVPLRRWRDVDGSQLSPASMLKAGVDVVSLGIARRLTRRARRT